MNDFLIIGGGVAGLSVGARLAPHGQVTLLEREAALGYHASGRSAAIFDASYGVASAVALSEASRSELTPFLSARGMMLLGRKQDAEAFERDAKNMGFKALSPSDAQAKVPILNTETTAQAAYKSDAWDIDTARLLDACAAKIRAHGGKIALQTAVRGLSHSGGRWQAQTESGGAIEAGIVVNAAGAWADNVAQLAGAQARGLRPMRRSMAQIPAPGGHDISDWPMLLGAGERWYAKPSAGKMLVSPADQDQQPPMDAWADDMVLAEGIARYQEMVTPEVTRLETSWAGLRTIAPDRNMVLGWDGHVPGLFWMAGQGGNGIQTAPAAGHLAADLILGNAPDFEPGVVAALSPTRFF